MRAHRCPPCDRWKAARNRGLGVRRAGGRLPRNRDDSRVGGPDDRLMATRSHERSEQALEQFRGSAVHETQVDETLRLVTPVAHVKHLVQLGPEEAEVGRGNDVIPRRRLHAAPVNSAANGGVYVIMSSETRRTMSTPVTSDE